MILLLFVVLVFLLGLTIGILIGLVLSDFCGKWAVVIMKWIYKRFHIQGGR
jgi:ABC-type dipeptide/oligopeptide/nickel transport system permease subunit